MQVQRSKSGPRRVARVSCRAGFAVFAVLCVQSRSLPARAQSFPGALPSQSLVQPIAVFGADDRTAVPAKYRAFRERIGLLLNTRTQSVCTAFCVAPDIVATASHCIYPSPTAPVPRIAEFLFAPDFQARRTFVRAAGSPAAPAAQYVLSGALGLRVKPPIEAAKDWALVRLAQPACRSSFGIRAMPAEQVMAEAAAGRIFQLAYHRDHQPYRLAYSKPCAVDRTFPGAEWSTVSKDFSDPGHILLHTCDTGGSSSGSPILLETSEGAEVIGINVGTYEQSQVEIENGKVVRRAKSEPVANTAVSALAFAPKIEILRQAAILTQPGQLRALQQALKQRGDYQGAVDGRFSPTLRLAIETYERASGLPVTGLATQALLKRLTTPLSGALPRAPG